MAWRAAVSHLWEWPWGTGFVFDLALSVASTVVLLRALEERGLTDSEDGRIAVGWLIVGDLVTVVALMLVAGRRAAPWLLGRVVGTESRELFTLAVLAIALGIAVGAAGLFGVSFALGAFFAGVVVSESRYSHEAAESALPLQDAFAVLFFVSVGMLFDPGVLVREPLEVLAVVAIILVGKALAAAGIVRLFGYPLRTVLTISASLAQIGEFSFILAALGVSLGLLPREAQSLVVAGALLSITLNPFVFSFAHWLAARVGAVGAAPAGAAHAAPAPAEADGLRDHVVLVGHGRVGGPVADELARHGVPYVVVEESRAAGDALRARGVPVVVGDATRAEVLGAAHVDRARLVVVAAPDAFQTRAVVALAGRLNSGAAVLARTHSDAERAYLEAHGAAAAFVGERELAVSLARAALRGAGVVPDIAAVAARALHADADGGRPAAAAVDG